MSEATSSNVDYGSFAGKQCSLMKGQKCDGVAILDLEIRVTVSTVPEAIRQGLQLAKSAARFGGGDVCNILLR